MTDYFEALGFERSPWVEPAAVQRRFLEVSAAAHPDRVHNLGGPETAAANENFSELNRAAATLRDHKERLHHLLALETGAAPSTAQNIPADFIELFTRIGQTCRSIDQFLAERSRANSPMLQAQLFAKGLDWSDAVSELQTQVGVMKATAEKELREMAGRWPQEKPLEKVAALAHMFAMVAKWERQLQERFAGLAAG